MFWVDWCLCSVSLLHCVVGWLVFCVPSTMCFGLVSVLCPFYTVLWVGLCSVSLLHTVVGWSVFLFFFPYTLSFGLVGVCVLCPFFTVLLVGL